MTPVDENLISSIVQRPIPCTKAPEEERELERKRERETERQREEEQEQAQEEQAQRSQHPFNNNKPTNKQKLLTFYLAYINCRIQ
jgi:hypothetical protein